MADWHDSPEWRKARALAKKLLPPVCAICQKELSGSDWTIDHIHPAGSDGEPDHSLSNLQSMCRECNGRKSDRKPTRTNWMNPKWMSANG